MGGKRLRRNLLCLLGAAAVLLISLVPARYSNEVYAYLPFFALLCLLLLSLAGTLLLRRGVRVTSESQDMECRRGESLPMAVQVRNDGPLSCPQARAWLYVSNLFREEDTVTPASFTLAGRSVSDFSFDIKMTHVGEYRAGLRDMEVYDFLGLFRLPVPGRRDLRVTVLPREVLPRELELSDKMLTESHDQHKSMVSDGFDYSGVREYAMGDSMKRIHWKLSAHSLDYMTKITETSLRNDLPVLLGNDADCAAVGEYLRGAGRGCRDFIVVTLGTGVGAGIILDGRLRGGDASSEAGHIVTHAGGEPCPCGRRGCWEQYASAPALVRMTRAAMTAHPESALNRLAAESGTVEGRTPFQAAEAGDKTALTVCRQYAEELAEGIISIVNLLRPEAVAVGGGVAGAPDHLLLEPLRRLVAERSYSRHGGRVTRILRAELGNDAGIIGAALLGRVI